MSEWRMRLARLLEGFNDDEGDVMLRLARRLQRGRASYGPLDLARDQRDWAAEEIEERLDAVIYREFSEIKKLRMR